MKTVTASASITSRRRALCFLFYTNHHITVAPELLINWEQDTDTPDFLFSYYLPEAELAPKREVPPGEATALEALLRNDSVLEKKNNINNEEETMLEIQVLRHVYLLLSGSCICFVLYIF